MHRFRKPAGMKVPREFESPPLRTVKSVAWLVLNTAILILMAIIPDSLKKYHSHNRVPIHIHFSSLTYLDYNYIDDGIYIGTNQCCTEGLIEVIRKEGITCDISLEEERLDQPFGVETYTWIPTKDDSIPTMEQLDFCVQTLEYLVGKGKKIYLHCKNGHGRSSTFLSAYLIKTRGFTPEQALEFIRSKRPTAAMHPVQSNFVRTYYIEKIHSKN